MANSANSWILSDYAGQTSQSMSGNKTVCWSRKVETSKESETTTTRTVVIDCTRRLNGLQTRGVKLCYLDEKS